MPLTLGKSLQLSQHNDRLLISISLTHALALLRSIGYPLTSLMENSFGKPVEVEVRDSLEKAMKILKQKMSKEGILQELKRRRFYEKPSVKKKRKSREARKRTRREANRRVTPAPMR